MGLIWYAVIGLVVGCAIAPLAAVFAGRLARFVFRNI